MSAAAKVIQQARTAGILLTVSQLGGLKLTGGELEISRLKPDIITHKGGIIALLLEPGANLPEVTNDPDGTPHFRWLVHYLDRDSHETTSTPSLIHAQVLEWFKEAIAAEPLPDCPVMDEAVTSDDERINCQQCAKRTGSGRCMAAVEVGMIKTYSPDPSILRRCNGYAPRPADPDQRTGKERGWKFIPNFIPDVTRDR
jgi:hypothetical protein